MVSWMLIAGAVVFMIVGLVLVLVFWRGE